MLSVWSLRFLTSTLTSTGVTRKGVFPVDDPKDHIDHCSMVSPVFFTLGSRFAVVV